jgi:hypothetical protein
LGWDPSVPARPCLHVPHQRHTALPVATDGPHWPHRNIARDLALLPHGTSSDRTDGNAGYVLDGFGGLHPVVYDSPQPPQTAANQAYWPTWDIARGVAMARYR